MLDVSMLKDDIAQNMTGSGNAKETGNLMKSLIVDRTLSTMRLYGVLHRATVFAVMVMAAMLHTSVSAQAVTVTYYYTDPQGNVLATADENGNILTQSDWTPYGTQVLGAATSAPGFTGQVTDPENDLVYMQARYYDPVSGRFLSGDPLSGELGKPLAFGRFTYGNDNPLSYTDPTGGFPAGMTGSQISCEIYHCQTFFFSDNSSGGADSSSTMSRVNRPPPQVETISSEGSGVPPPSTLDQEVWAADAPYLE